MNKRQSQIIKQMIYEEACITSSFIADFYGVSLRTAQNDIKSILSYCNENNLKYTFNKQTGYQLIDCPACILKDNNNTNVRIKFILRSYLFASHPIKVEKIADTLYISLTTLNKDIQSAKEILSKYDLQFISKPYYGSHIEGSEANKRNCIINEELISFHNVTIAENHKPHIDLKCLNLINSIITKSLISHNFNITDNDYQNFLLLAYLSTTRNVSGQQLEDDYLNDVDLGKAYEIAKDIIETVSQIYHFIPKNSEARYLALALFGKNSLLNTEIIPIEIEEHVSRILQNINDILKIDLSYSIELRVSLSLHIMPLLERIKANNQIQENPIKNLYKNFSYSFELAIIACQYIENLTNCRLTKAELAYLAVHFKVILIKDKNKADKKNILFICSSRRSDSLLIKSGIYNYFSNRINQIDVKNVYELKNIDITKYNVVFSTVLNNDNIPKNAIKINHFLTDSDYNAIEFTLNYGSLFKMVDPLFSKDRFIYAVHASDKYQVIRQLVKLSQDIVDPQALLESIVDREKSGYTSYGNLIALPHPSYLFSHQSFCSVAILDEPIIWSENNKAQIIILCCASKDSSKDLQMLFNFISLLFDNTNKVESIIKDPTYDTFIECLSTLQNSI